MKDLPNAFWAALFMDMAMVLAIVCLFAPMRENITMAVVTMSSSIITGAFGYIQGRKDEANSVTVPPNPGSSTTVSVVPAQIDPTKDAK